MTLDLNIYCDLSLNHGALITHQNDSTFVIAYDYPSGLEFSNKAKAIASACLNPSRHQTNHVNVYYEATVFGKVGIGFSQYNNFLGFLFSELHSSQLNGSRQVNVYSILPTVLKKAITGNGRADKVDILDAVFNYLPNPELVTRLGKRPKSLCYDKDTYKLYDKHYDISDATSVLLASKAHPSLFKREPLISKSE